LLWIRALSGAVDIGGGRWVPVAPPSLVALFSGMAVLEFAPMMGNGSGGLVSKAVVSAGLVFCLNFAVIL
jgi:hypothetical protein